MMNEKNTDLDFWSFDEELEGKPKDDACNSEEPITEINTFEYGHFALGDRVYYLRPYFMYRIKCGTIKQFILKCDDLIIRDYDIVLDNGDVVRDRDLFRTLADIRAEVIKCLKSSIVNDRNRLAGLQREIAINERRLATLQNYDEKMGHQGK